MTSKAVQFVQLLRSSKREKRLGTVILFVTSRCNAFCQTCFYHEELNQPGDMTFFGRHAAEIPEQHFVPAKRQGDERRPRLDHRSCRRNRGPARRRRGWP